MPTNLIIVIVLVAIVFLLYILDNIKKKKLNMKYALIWIICDLFIIVFSLTFNQLVLIAKFFGIVTVSNMLFFSAFLFLSYMILRLTKIISKQNNEIINLTQEIAILGKEKNEK